MHVNDARFIDLEQSIWDKKKSNPELGVYDFSKKVEVSYRGDQHARPSVYLTWENTHPYTMADARNKWPGLETVKVGGRFWPEGICPNANGEYVFKDVVLVAIPIPVWIAQRREEIRRASTSPEAMKKQVAQVYKDAGVDIGEEELQALFSSRPTD